MRESFRKVFGTQYQWWRGMWQHEHDLGAIQKACSSRSLCRAAANIFSSIDGGWQRYYGKVKTGLREKSGRTVCHGFNNDELNSCDCKWSSRVSPHHFTLFFGCSVHFLFFFFFSAGLYRILATYREKISCTAHKLNWSKQWTNNNGECALTLCWSWSLYRYFLNFPRQESVHFCWNRFLPFLFQGEATSDLTNAIVIALSTVHFMAADAANVREGNHRNKVLMVENEIYTGKFQPKKK